MREIKVEDLQIGDEILIPSNANFKYLRVLKAPVLNKGKNYWGRVWYKSIRCSGRRELVKNKNGFEYLEWIFTPNDHNVKINVNLNFTQILLLNR